MKTLRIDFSSPPTAKYTMMCFSVKRRSFYFRIDAFFNGASCCYSETLNDDTKY